MTKEGKPSARRRGLRVGSAALALGLALSPAGVSARDQAPGLEASVTVYGWLPWIDGTLATGRGELSASIDAGNVLEALDFAAFAAADLQYGRFGLIGDLVYSKLSDSGRLNGPFALDAAVSNKLFMGTLAGTYRPYESERASVDLMAGLRVLSFDTRIRVTGDGSIGITRAASNSTTLVDPVIGIRGRLRVTPDLSVIGFADIGGFGLGTDVTWEVFGGIDYRITDAVSLKSGFRFLSIDYKEDGAELDLDLMGPVVGVTVGF